MSDNIQQYINQLNEAQRAPVIQKDGAMIVIAGAGSGKTRVLTVRIANLMSQGVDAFNILALTFTRQKTCGWEHFTPYLQKSYEQKAQN